MKQVAQALSMIMGTEVDISTATRIVDALCGLAGHETTTEPAERLRVGADATRQWIVGQVQAWEQIVARRALPDVAPIDLG
jgi:hypothetical protein